jgi:hypothetical protein
MVTVCVGHAAWAETGAGRTICNNGSAAVACRTSRRFIGNLLLALSIIIVWL